jgi:hypothetical protein
MHKLTPIIVGLLVAYQAKLNLGVMTNRIAFYVALAGLLAALAFYMLGPEVGAVLLGIYFVTVYWMDTRKVPCHNARLECRTAHSSADKEAYFQSNFDSLINVKDYVAKNGQFECADAARAVCTGL